MNNYRLINKPLFNKIIMNNLVNKYIKSYKENYYSKENNVDYNYIKSVLIKYQDKLDISLIGFITKHISINELVLIYDKKAFEFNKDYCNYINRIIHLISNLRVNINNEELNSLAHEFDRMKYGFLRCISENNSFRLFLKDLSIKNGVNSKNVILDLFAFIIAYIYYNSMDVDLVYQVAITFMCNYEEVIDILRINGYTLTNIIYSNEYIEPLLNIILTIKNKDKIIKKVL